MPVSLPTDDQLDPLEQADLEEELADETGEDHLATTTPSDDDASLPEPPHGTELDPDIVEEIKKVMVADEDLVDDGTSVKSKSHFIPQQLINQPLNPEKDLWDEDGTI